MRGAVRIACGLLISSWLATAMPGQVTNDQLLHAGEIASNWLQYSGTYDGHRYSTLSQISRDNVSNLAVQWIAQSPAQGPFESTPIVVDGIMYVTGQENTAFAVDARTGRKLWTYKRALPENIKACCGHVNRGFAMLGTRLFMATLDAHLIALDAPTGNLLWDVMAADYEKGYAFTVAPLVVKNKVIVGISGGEFGIRGFIDAYDVETGARAWRLYTIPAPGEPGSETWPDAASAARGGAPAWITGSYDAELNLLYWPTGNPSPSDDGSGRKGDNLYANCVLAINPDTGKLAWHFQFTPYDLHDWDATEVPVLVDTVLDGKTRKLLVHSDRNGFFYALDRTNGQFLFAKDYAGQNWAKAIGADGRPVLLPIAAPNEEGVRTCPGAAGATNWMSPTYSPQTGLFYVSVREQCDIFYAHPQKYVAGRLYIGSAYIQPAKEKDWGAVRAIDPKSGEVKWEYKELSAPWAGNLSTAGGLVFTGDVEGNLIALDAATGQHLWHLPTGAGIWAAPITYSVTGKQYVVIASGTALIALALGD